MSYFSSDTDRVERSLKKLDSLIRKLEMLERTLAITIWIIVAVLFSAIIFFSGMAYVLGNMNAR